MQVHVSPGETKGREVELGPQENPGETKSREAELGPRKKLDNPSLQLFFNGCFWDNVSAALFRAAVETAISEVIKLILCTGGVPTSLTLLFWRSLAVSPVFEGRSAGTSY